MINSNELRIGNIVDAINKRYNEKYIIVESVNSECINSDWRPYNFIQLTPIPLTPEVLLAAGFQKNKWAEEYSRSLFGDYSLSFDEVLTFKCDDDFYNYNLTQIKYLHQLQNLIHSLTGTELEIDLIKAIK